VSIPVSICLTTYNRARVLPSTLDSLLAQDFGDFELIISDNASSDDTEEVCRQYERRDRRVRYFRNPANLGMPGNLNAAITRASGEYIANVHDGDLYRSDLLRQWKDALDEAPDSPFVFNTYDCVRKTGEHFLSGEPFSSGVIPGSYIAEYFFRTATCCVWGTVMARRSAYHKQGPFDASFGFISDVEMWLRMAHGKAIAYVAEPLITLSRGEKGDKPYFGPWRQMFWTVAIYSKMLRLYSDVIPEETRQYSRGFAQFICRLALYRMATLVKNRRWESVREGLKVWRDSPVTALAVIGRLMSIGVSPPDWYDLALWEPLADMTLTLRQPHKHWRRPRLRNSLQPSGRHQIRKPSPKPR